MYLLIQCFTFASLNNNIMPTAGNFYIATLKKTHLGWGIHRRTKTRTARQNEGFLPIPSKYSIAFNITNFHNQQQSATYHFSTSDGFIKNKLLLASGNKVRGDIFAKNFHGKGDLKLLGYWFQHINAKIGDHIKVEFLSSTEILLTHWQPTATPQASI
ncbi:hypothetical protein [Flavobacterium sp.]|uniref:hypothetical protein n=1 Tax=Flavobacterium sp. TaxID=239 RepID=UPI00262314F3|nr:hypothetical protein [Flavobacterium sp.]